MSRGHREPRWRRYLRFHGRDVSADTEAELEFHLTERQRLYEARGMTPEEARRKAIEKMGDLEHVRRDCAREDRSAETRRRRRQRAATLGHDLRVGWRSLVRRPGFAAVAILTLGLGAGVTAGIYGIVEAVLLRPLPYPTEDRVAVLWEVEPDRRVPVRGRGPGSGDLRGRGALDRRGGARGGVGAGSPRRLGGSDEDPSSGVTH